MKFVSPSTRKYYRRDLASTLTYFGLIALIFAQYMTTAIPAYVALIIALLLRANIKLPSRIIVYICAVTLYWLPPFSYLTGKNIVTHILYYFGFLLSLIVFASDKRISIDFFVNEKFLIGLCLLTISEAILFNLPIAQHLYF